jgi:hypothetical protein
VGGGIASQFGASTTIRQSALIGNIASSVGGGVYVDDNDAFALVVVNSTFSGNTGSDGGAIYINGQSQGFDTALTYVTMVDNVATGANNADDIVTGGGTFTLSCSILTHPAGSSNPECGGTLIGALNGSDNLIDTNTSCLSAAANFRRGKIANGALGPLGPNGGPTSTYPLTPGNGGLRDPVDAVPGGCSNPLLGAPITQDQRGQPRPSGPDFDIGAYES